MTRDEFKQHAMLTYYTKEDLGILDDNEPFWIPEYREGWKASCFIECYIGRIHKETFWEWCRNNMSKVPMCFMSNKPERKEWWGFNTEEDMMLFLLRWSK